LFKLTTQNTSLTTLAGYQQFPRRVTVQNTPLIYSIVLYYYRV